ncbi:MAG: MFS transporter [Candidatus Bathyarchaeota archaeon]|nr:MFS transporter [Candidatus Bathyarchaeota archaeon]
MEKQKSLALTILAAVCLTYFVENFLRSAASALTPVLITELGISRASMGLLITGYFLIYGIMQLPAGVLADVLGPRKSILWFTALTCIGGALFWLSYRYELLLVAQMIMGIGTSVFYINAVTVIIRWFPPERKATAIGVLSAASGVGGFASYMGFPLAQSILGNWRALYLVMLVVLVANWAINIFVLKDSPTPITVVKREPRNIVAAIKETLSDKRFGPMIFTYTLLGFNYVLLSWGAQFLIESKGLTYVEAGMVTSLGTVAGFIGCLSMGVISDRLRKRKTPIIAFFSLFILALIGIVLMPAGLGVAVYATLWCLMGIGNSVWVIYFSMVGEVLPARKASIGLGLLNGSNIVFSSVMTPLYGSIVDQTGSFFIPGLISIGIAAVTFVVLLRFTRETYGSVIKE